MYGMKKLNERNLLKKVERKYSLRDISKWLEYGFNIGVIKKSSEKEDVEMIMKWIDKLKDSDFNVQKLSSMYRKDFNVLELKRKLNLNKKKFVKDLNDIFYVLNIDSKNNYLSEFEGLMDNMINCGIQLEKVREEMENLDKEFEGLKKSIVFKENIDLREKLMGFGNRKNEILDGLYNSGFIGNEEWEKLKEYFWNNRYRKVYSD